MTCSYAAAHVRSEKKPILTTNNEAFLLAIFFLMIHLGARVVMACIVCFVGDRVYKMHCHFGVLGRLTFVLWYLTTPFYSIHASDDQPFRITTCISLYTVAAFAGHTLMLLLCCAADRNCCFNVKQFRPIM